MKLRAFTTPEIHRIADAWRRNVPIAVIACDFDRSIGSLHNLISRNHDLFPQRHASRRGKLFDRAKAKELRAAGLTYAEIGECLGVTGGAIWVALKEAA